MSVSPSNLCEVDALLDAFNEEYPDEYKVQAQGRLEWAIIWRMVEERNCFGQNGVNCEYRSYRYHVFF